MAFLWNQASNTSLASLVENVTSTIDLPVEDGSTVSLISGKLPNGMRISSTSIIGTPKEVARVTEFRFVLRASKNSTIEDRTFKISVSGPDTPEWITPAGDLAVGNNDTYYILDSSPIEFQLLATDDDIEAGQTLEFFMKDGDGELPPGTELTSDGRIIGIVDPLLAIERGEIYASGFYDTSPYDLQSGGYDFGIRSSNGYDSFFYDTTVWDFSYNEKPPKKLNRYYQFTVNVTDGDTIARRTFKIFVVGDDFFRADNTILQVGTGTFTADNTNLRTPIWITPSDLGIKRANNYVTLTLDIIDTNSVIGFVNYELESTNPGTYKLKSTGEIITNGRYEISGVLPKFVDSARGPDSYIGTVPNPITPDEWEVITPETVSSLPPGLDLDTSNGEIAGRIPYQAEVTKEFNFTIKATRFTPDEPDVNVFARKTFKIRVLGEINSETTWITPSDLGTLTSNAISVLRVEASTSVPRAKVLYSLADGRLPPGLRLTYDGEIVGKVNAYGESVYKGFWKSNRNYNAGDVVRHDGNLYKTLSTHSSATFENGLWIEFSYSTTGLTTIDSDTTVFDGADTSIDRSYTFSVNAEDQYKYSIVKKEFVIKVTDPEITKYSNIYLKPFLKQDITQEFRNFISNPEIFNPEYIYRPGDPNFGIQGDVRIPVYYGIENKAIGEFVAASAKNHKRKQYRVGELKTAQAKTEGTNDVVYEVLYLEVKDPSDTDVGRTRKKINIKTTKNITTDIQSKVPKNSFYNYTEAPSFVVNTRKGPISVTLGEDFIVETKDGNYNLVWTLGVEIDSRTESNLLSIIEGLSPVYNNGPEYTNVIKADTDAIDVSMNKDNVRYISNINNMRDNIREVGVTNRNFVPLWMRSPQDGSVNELGYTPAIVLCYCKPGTSNIVKSAVEASNFDFKQFNLDVDRYVVDSTSESSQEKYIVFQNYRFNV
jgi:hypothetical protein